MLVNNQNYQTIWLTEKTVNVIDQNKLPFEFSIKKLKSLNDTIQAIKEMNVRGAGLIGVTAAYGLYLATLNLSDENLKSGLKEAAQQLKATRPTAVNLANAVNKILTTIKEINEPSKIRQLVKETAQQIEKDDILSCQKIGEYGAKIIEKLAQGKKRPLNILTHCNAGWLAFVDYGSALSPIYQAYFEKKIDLHVWVDETRPRNQGANLTYWELSQAGIPCTLIADNTGGHLMQQKMVDLVITGADRVTSQGDVANKIGTYLKALAAADNEIPFYVAFPSSTIDWQLKDGKAEIPIEKRSERELSHLRGLNHKNEIIDVQIYPDNALGANYGFDITPNRLITGLISERGICAANSKSLKALYEY